MIRKVQSDFPDEIPVLISSATPAPKFKREREIRGCAALGRTCGDRGSC